MKTASELMDSRKFHMVAEDFARTWGNGSSEEDKKIRLEGFLEAIGGLNGGNGKRIVSVPVRDSVDSLEDLHVVETPKRRGRPPKAKTIKPFNYDEATDSATARHVEEITSLIPDRKQNVINAVMKQVKPYWATRQPVSDLNGVSRRFTIDMSTEDGTSLASKGEMWVEALNSCGIRCNKIEMHLISSGSKDDPRRLFELRVP